MKARLIAVICLIMVLALSTLGGTRSTASESSAAPPPPHELTLSEESNGLQVELAENQMLVLRLESNPATGYAWEVQGVDRNVLVQKGGFEFEPADQIGGPGTQIMRFAGVSKGQTPLKLVYRRPWEDAGSLKTYSVDVKSGGAFKGTYLAPAPVEAPAIPEEETTEADLPSQFNWCDQGGCTSVKDQGSCGSCWAFGTVAPFESAIKIKDGQTTNLSEQYLVSCNAEGWGCNGGWWAHDYHEWKYISGESGPGAVYESDFPYQAADVPCNPPHPHPYILDDWVQLSSGVPSVSAIKQAIYDYGPVSAAVCVNSAFQNYNSDIFTGPSCSSVNHGVTLVGWNDSNGGYWYLKNSWGSDWGESGYMRIQWGVSRIGYRAAYVVYSGSGPTPTPTEPPPPADILVVDDDAGKSYEGYYTAALGALGKSYHTWNVQSQGSPSASKLGEYEIVIWFTGDDYTTTLTSTDQSNLQTYLNGGGKLFISGQDIGYDIRTASFYGNYLHASYIRDDTNTYGLTGADVLSGVGVTISGSGGANNQSYPSEIGLGSGAVGVFDYDGSYTWGGLRWEGAYKVVYLSFGYEAINTASARTTVMDKVLEWLEGGAPPPTPTSPPPPTDTPEPPPTDTPEPPTPTPTPGGEVFSDDFETDQGWTVNPSGTDTATTGMWERANPQSTSYGGTTYQMGTTASGSYDLVTEGSAGSSVGSYDIDNGVTSIRSPNITLPSGSGITLSFQYYLSHYSNGSSSDYLRVKVVGSTTQTVLEELASGNIDGAAWESFSTSLDAFAGQTIYLLIEAADGGSGSLIEAAIDDVLIE
jgi:C1A family cysteine protease